METPPPVSSLFLQMESMATRVRSLTGRSDLDWLLRPSPGEWSLTEIMCHLRDVEQEIHQYRFQMLIDKDNAFIPGVATDEWAAVRNYRHQDGPEAAEQFLKARQDTISLLSSIEESIWMRQGRHTLLGPTSMHELLHLAVRHDDLHWEQTRNLLALQNLVLDD